MSRSQAPSPSEADLQFMATHDELTGLLNRRGLNESLGEIIKEQPGQFGIILIDLDGVKGINDTEGHSSGDALLVRVSSVLKKTVRQSRDDGSNDIVVRGRGHEARTGGDEFVALFPGVASEQDMKVVENRLRNNFEEARISASTGSQVHQEDMDAASILTLADAKMYEHKERRKLALYAPEQVEVIEHVGSLLIMHEVDPRDLPSVLSALQKKTE